MISFLAAAALSAGLCGPLAGAEPEFRCAGMDLPGTYRVYGDGRLEDQGSVAATTRVFAIAPKQAAAYPVIIFSHGGFADPDPSQLPSTSYVFDMVREGFVVLLPVHPDSRRFDDVNPTARVTTCDGNPSGDAGAIARCGDEVHAWYNRLSDIQITLDTMSSIVSSLGAGYAKAPVAPVIAGYSFGAFTAQLAAGARIKTPDSTGVDVRPLSGAEFSAVLLLSPQGLRGSQYYSGSGGPSGSVSNPSGYGLYRTSSTDNSWRFGGADRIAKPLLMFTGTCDNTEDGEGPDTKDDVYEFSRGGTASTAKHLYKLGTVSSCQDGRGDGIANNGSHSDFGPNTGDVAINETVRRFMRLFLDAYAVSRPLDTIPRGAGLALAHGGFFNSSTAPEVSEIVTGTDPLKATNLVVAGAEYVGGDGADVVLAGSTTNSIDGRNGGDTILGANDEITTITGGHGADLFVTTLAHGKIDVIQDFDAASDKINVSASVNLYLTQRSAICTALVDADADGIDDTAVRISINGGPCSNDLLFVLNKSVPVESIVSD